MSIARNELINYLNDYLDIHSIKDYCPNGLQVEGSEKITKIVTGVTASQELIDRAVTKQADLLLVHHGYFWKGEASQIVGLKKNRIRALLVNDLSMAGYHLPLDIHSDIGNNVELGKKLELKDIQAVSTIKPVGIVYRGRLPKPISASELGQMIGDSLARTPLVVETSDKLVETIAWCTGGGQGYIDDVVGLGIDVFLTGEVSEKTVHSAREHQIHFIAAGHHATERYGIKALGEHIGRIFNIDVEFIDIDNPA